MNQLFSVGEVAILQSIDLSEYWGIEVTITHAKFSDNPYLIDGTIATPSFVYEVDLLPDRQFLQCALRKKQNPGNLSKDELMNVLCRRNENVI